MVEPIFVAPFFLDYILPWVLVFTLLFAILQKTKLLGDDVKQINALIASVVGLILIASPFSRIVVILMPFLAISAVVLLIFLLLYGFISGKKEGDMLSENWKRAWVTILAIALASVLLMVSGYWGFVYSYLFERPEGAQVWINGLLVIVIIGALVAVLRDNTK
jgi:peptidoglycan/LPS O-acetylase OafA/YrhL